MYNAVNEVVPSVFSRQEGRPSHLIGSGILSALSLMAKKVTALAHHNLAQAREAHMWCWKMQARLRLPPLTDKNMSSPWSSRQGRHTVLCFMSHTAHLVHVHVWQLTVTYHFRSYTFMFTLHVYMDES